MVKICGPKIMKPTLMVVRVMLRVVIRVAIRASSFISLLYSFSACFGIIHDGMNYFMIVHFKTFIFPIKNTEGKYHR